MNATIDAKNVKLNSSLAKHLSITNSSSWYGFLTQIKWHDYDLCYEESQMSQKKFQCLVISQIDVAQKVK